MPGRLLVVAALAEEAASVPPGVEVLVTGVGKVAAAAGLARRLATGPGVGRVVNIGTAGAVHPGVAGLVEVGYVTQHDFPYRAVEELLDRSLPRGFRLDGGPVRPAGAPSPGARVLASADAFVADPATAARLAAAGVDLVDMEGYGYAAAAAAFGTPLSCVKVVSDGADAAAAASWRDAVAGCAAALGAWLAARPA